MNSQCRSYRYADRELVIQVGDILQAGSEVMVCPNNSMLSSERGLAGVVSAAAGQALHADAIQLIKEYGELLYGMAMSTSAGSLSFNAIIHAVSPMQGCGHEGRSIEQAVTNSLLLCEANHWVSIAFPALGTGGGSIAAELSAQAMIRAILRYWDARMESIVERVHIYVRGGHFQDFIGSVDAQNAGPEVIANGRHSAGVSSSSVADKTRIGEPEEMDVGEIELSDKEITDLDSDDISDWFK